MNNVMRYTDNNKNIKINIIRMKEKTKFGLYTKTQCQVEKNNEDVNE